MSKIRSLAVGTFSAALIATSTLLSAAPAAAATVSYVALGDSYSSGTGTGNYLDDGTECLRSQYAYASLLAAAKNYQLNLRACSGAVARDVVNNQVSALNSGTDVVTISIGGNDAGFADVLTECAKPGWMSNCNGAIDGAENIIDTVLPGRLQQVYTQIANRAPNATVVVLGYPRLFMGEDCQALTWFSPAEQARLNGVADRLSSTISSAARAYGFTYRSAIPAFTGHAVCDSPEWVNGLSWPIVESFHPNRTGHSQGYLPLVSSATSGAAVTADDRVFAAADAQASAQADLQRQYSAADARVTPKQFRTPNLDSAEAKTAAAAAGVNLASRASIDRLDTAYSYLQAKAVGLGDTIAGGAAAARQAGVVAADTALGAVKTVSDAGKNAANKAKEWGAAAWDRLGG